MTNGGSSRDRRRLRRAIEGILEKYGYLPKTNRDPTNHSHLVVSDIILKYVVSIIALTLSGYKLLDDHVYLASLAYVLALVIFLLGVRFLRGSKRKAVTKFILSAAGILVFLYSEFQWIRNELTPTFLYLVPTRELIECERRAFFVNHSGLKDLENVEVVIKDNKSGTVQTESYAEIDSGPQNTDVPRYIWVKPSHPWDEDYTITIAARKFHSVPYYVVPNRRRSLPYKLPSIGGDGLW